MKATTSGAGRECECEQKRPGNSDHLAVEVDRAEIALPLRRHSLQRAYEKSLRALLTGTDR